jgi:dihydrofolate reductase
MKENRGMGTITMIAAFGRNRVIGNNNEIPWRLPGEQQRFKRLTMGHTLVMGRRTYESIGRPLPGRTSIVVTRQPEWTAAGVTVTHSLEDALTAATGAQVFIAGGGQIYQQAMSISDRLEVTEVDRIPVGDVVFPEINTSDWRQTAREPRDGYTFLTYDRMRPQ